MHSSAPGADGKEKGRPGGERQSEGLLDDRKKEPEYQKEIEKEDKKEKEEEESQHRKYENKRCIYYFPSCQEGN